MSTALDKIIAYKRDEVAALKRAYSEADLLEMVASRAPAQNFSQALRNVAERDENALICELKRKSPSAGIIAEGANPIDIAQSYESGGAACLSVLTDGPSFGGSADDFKAIRAAVTIPMLRKDFMIDTRQVIEARAMGADAILVILSCTQSALANDLIQTASALGMASLIETHDRAEIERALKLPSTLLGINNRDLKVMRTDLATTETLVKFVPPNVDIISESGISGIDDISRLRKTGVRRFLIGESLMKRSDRAAHVRRLRTAL